MSNGQYEYSWDFEGNQRIKEKLIEIDKFSIKPSTCYRVGSLKISDALYSAYAYEQMQLIQNTYLTNSSPIDLWDGSIGTKIEKAIESQFHDLTEQFLFEYSKIPAELLERIIPLITVLPEIDYRPCGEQNSYLKPIAYNAEFYVSLLDDIFKSFDDPEIYEKFKNYIDPKNKRLLLIPKGKNIEFDVMTLIDTFYRKAFTYLGIRNNIMDFFELGGALLHMCVREDIARSGYDQREEQYLYDLEKHFFAFVASGYIRKTFRDAKPFTRLIRQFDYLAYHDMIDCAFNLAYTDALYRTEDPEYVLHKYPEELRKEINSPFVPNSIMEDDLTDLDILSFNINNIASYLAAKDVYREYQNSKQEGISRLRLNASLTYPAHESLDIIGTTFHQDRYSEMIKTGQRLFKQKTRA